MSYSAHFTPIRPLRSHPSLRGSGHPLGIKVFWLCLGAVANYATFDLAAGSACAAQLPICITWAPPVALPAKSAGVALTSFCHCSPASVGSAVVVVCHPGAAVLGVDMAAPSLLVCPRVPTIFSVVLIWFQSFFKSQSAWCWLRWGVDVNTGCAGTSANHLSLLFNCLWNILVPRYHLKSLVLTGVTQEIPDEPPETRFSCFVCHVWWEGNESHPGMHVAPLLLRPWQWSAVISV